MNLMRFERFFPPQTLWKRIGVLSAGHKGMPDSLKSAEGEVAELRGFIGIIAREKPYATSNANHRNQKRNRP